MRSLDEALSEIAEMRCRMARSQLFRGYRAATVATTGTLGFLGAAVQPRLVPEAWKQPDRFVELWGGIAVACCVLTAVQLAVHVWRSDSATTREMTVMAVEQFAPSVIAGGLVTLGAYLVAPELIVFLPTLWSVLFGLGVLASSRILPRRVFAVGWFYIVCGALLLMGTAEPYALSPWQMGLSFGVGQSLLAAVLYWDLERFGGR